MKRRRLVIVGVVVGLACVAAGLWFFLRDRGGAPEERAGADVAARKRAARGSAPADLTPGSVAGVVKRKSDGAPLAGATVTVLKRELELGSQGRGGEPTLVTAGPDGRFEAAGLVPGKYAVGAAALGFLPAHAQVELGAGERKEGIEILLEAGGVELSGVVSDVSGGPIAGARVSAASHLAMWDPTPASATTGSDGSYRLSLAPGNYQLEASHPEYVTDDKTVEIVAARRVDFTLVPGAAIHGRVVTRGEGKGVPGARVTAAPADRGFDATGFGVESDAEGRFTVRGLAPGEVALRAVARGYGSSEPTLVELGIGEEIEGVIVLVDPAFTVSGFVVEKRDGETPIPGVVVGGFTIANRQAVLARAPSEKDGYFEIHGVAPGTYSVFALGEGLLPSVMSQTFRVEDRDIDDLIVGLERGVTVSGRVDPPAPADISLGVDEEDISLGNLGALIASQFARARTDERGEFVLRGVPPGKLNVRAHAEDGRRGKLPIEVGDADLTGLVVKLERRGAIAGRVVDDTGQPVEGVRVKARAKKAVETRSAAIDDALDRGAPTAADGSYRLAGLDAATYLLTVNDDRGQLAFTDAGHKADPYQPVEVRVEGTAEVGGVQLQVEARSGVIRGVVLGPNGAPAPDVWVTATRHKREKPKPPEGAPPPAEEKRVTVSVTVGSEGGESKVEQQEGDFDVWEDRDEPPVLTDEAGRFEVKRLRKAVYDVVAQDPKRALRGQAKDARPGDSVTVRLEAMAELSGVVRLSGAPVPDYRLAVTGPKEHTARVRKPDGAYALKRLPPGKYRVSARTDNGFAAGEIELQAGQKGTLDLGLSAWSRVTGTVVDGATGKPWKGLRYFSMAKDEVDEEAILDMIQGKGKETDGSGRFELGRLPPGEGQIMFMSGDLTSMRMVAEKKFTVGQGQTLDLGVVKALDVPGKATEPGVLGLEAGDKDGVLRVTSVAAGGAAAQAGIVVGDVILAVDGAAVVDYGADVIEQLLDAERVNAGQVVTVRLDKKGDVQVTARPPSS